MLAVAQWLYILLAGELADEMELLPIKVAHLENSPLCAK